MSAIYNPGWPLSGLSINCNNDFHGFSDDASMEVETHYANQKFCVSC